MKRSLRSRPGFKAIKSARHNETNEEQNSENAGILELNYDCLLKILSLLSLEDLCAVKDSCHELSLLAHVAAKRICENEKICITYGNKMDAFTIKKFGTYMHEVFYQNRQIDALLLENNEMRLLISWYKSFAWMKNCSILQTLSMQKINVRNVDQAYINNFGNLINLKIENCSDVKNFELILKACKNLKSIEVIDAFPEIIGNFRFLLNIEAIRFSTSMDNFEGYIIENYIAELGQLQSLKFVSLIFNLKPFSSWFPPKLIAKKFKVVKRDKWSCRPIADKKDGTIGVGCMRICDVTVTL